MYEYRSVCCTIQISVVYTGNNRFTCSPACPSIHLPVCLSVQTSVTPPVFQLGLSTRLSTGKSICRHDHWPTHQTINPLIHPSIHSSTHPYVCLLIINLSVHPSVHPSVHLPTHQSVHPSAHPPVPPFIVSARPPV